MKRTAAIFIAMLLATTMTYAQHFTEIVQEKQSGKGTVTIHQSPEVEAVVNGNINPYPVSDLPKPLDNKATPRKPTEQKTDDKGQTVAKKDSLKKNEPLETHNDTIQKKDTGKWVVRKNKTEDDDIFEKSKPDTSKKIMRNARKVTGYRVQVFAGGNKREDRERAQQAGNRIKAAFPDQPIYVHFYSPSWKCRMGNFVNYNEAKRVLNQVRNMGFKQAVIVKGKITVY